MARISIKKLFGRFSYDFDMGDMTGAGLIILTGPNGFGKTTILKAINAVSSSDLSFFADLMFESFEIVRDDIGEKILIEKQKEGLRINGIELSNKDIVLLRRGIFNRKRVVSDSSGDRLVAVQEESELSRLLSQMQKIFGKIQYIKEQRLVGEDDTKAASLQGEERVIYRKEKQEGVNNIPEKLKSLMRKLDFQYSQLSNKLDSTFPKRLFNLEEGISEDEFNRKINQMQEKIEKLNLNGISRLEKLDVTKFRRDDARALKIYFEDFDSKYQVYEKMIEQLELFREIVNNHLRFKHLEITSEHGMVVRDNDTKEKIRLNLLSSGEQEILVLYYKLLFETQKGTVVLIDEPEISLHIAWQRMFAQDLKRIVMLKDIYAVIATHSPQMVSGNRNIQYDLGEIYKNGLTQRE